MNPAVCYGVGILLLGVQLQVVVTQQCGSLSDTTTTNPHCQIISNCSGLTCLPSAPFDGYTASFSVTKCVDPVIVDLTVTPDSGQPYMSSFTTNNVVHFGGDVSISVTMARNATDLDFQATIFNPDTPPVPLFPESHVPLDADRCMCESIQAMATRGNNVHPSVESNCMTTRGCTAVQCELTIVTFFVYSVEVVVLPCDNAIEFLVKNAFGLTEATLNFVGPTNETKTFTILTFELAIHQIIVVFDYSMEVQAFLSESNLGEIEIIPRQTIQLDRTQCDNPIFTTGAPPTDAPPPAPPTFGAPYVCTKLYNIAQAIYLSSPLFRCYLKDNCALGLSCLLRIAHTQYRVNIDLFTDGLGMTVTDSTGQIPYGSERDMDMFMVPLPEPAVSSLLLKQKVDRQIGSIGFSLELSVNILGFGSSNQRTEDIIPYSVLLREFVAPQQCGSLSDTITTNPQCLVLSNCSGQTCLPSAPFDGYTASFSVTKCVDPVIVDLTLTSDLLDSMVYSNGFTTSGTVYFTSQTGIKVVMLRNATHLDFQATIFHPDSSSPISLFPKSFISLDVDRCMCESMQALASRAETIHPIIESNCVTTESCTGVRCRLNFPLSIVVFTELIVLPCDNAVEFLLENDAGLPLVEHRFNGPTNETIDFDFTGIPLSVQQIIVVSDYSMGIEAFLISSAFGRIEVIPRQTIQLDRTHCDIPMFPTVTVPTEAPPPLTLPSDKPMVCFSLLDVAKLVYTKTPIFSCELKEDCETGLACILDIFHTRYHVDILLDSMGLTINVTDLSEQIVYGSGRNNTVSVELQDPANSLLELNQEVDLAAHSVGFKLDLKVSFLTANGAQQQTDSLIPYSRVTLPGQTGGQTGGHTVMIVVIVVCLLFLVTLVAVVLCVLLIVWYCSKSNLSTVPFDFQRMSDLKDKELENYLNTPAGAPSQGDVVTPEKGGANE